MNSKFIIATLGVVAICVLPGYHYARHVMSSDTVTVKVTDKERSNDKDGSRYMVFTDSEVFTNEDSWMALKFNSSDVQGKITIGQTCTFKVDGFRVPFMSWYRNIYALEGCK